MKLVEIASSQSQVFSNAQKLRIKIKTHPHTHTQRINQITEALSFSVL